MSAAAVVQVLAAHMSSRGRAERIHPADGPNCGWAIVRVCKCGEWSAPVMHDDSDKAAHRAHVAEALQPVIAAAQARAYDDGYNDAATMARCYGHTDYWPAENERRNPYRIGGAS